MLDPPGNERPARQALPHDIGGLINKPEVKEQVQFLP